MPSFYTEYFCKHLSQAITLCSLITRSKKSAIINMISKENCCCGSFGFVGPAMFYLYNAYLLSYHFPVGCSMDMNRD
jgi:hypothetical protein